MPRKKGTPKTGGRKKGTPNKTTAEMKQWVGAFLSKSMQSLDELYEALPPDKQAELAFSLLPKLLPFVLAKQNETKHSIDEQQMEAVKEAMDKVNDLFK